MRTTTESQPAIAITGLGVVSPYGVGLDAFRAGLESGRSCIGTISAYDLSRCRATKGAYYTGFQPDAFDASSGFGRMARGTQFSIMATDEALRAAGVSSATTDPTRLGVVFSSARVALEKTERFYATLIEKGPRLVNPLVFQETVNNAPASHICLRYGITGPSLTITSGGAGGLQAVAVAMQWLRLGRASVVVVTATEALHAVSQEIHSFARGHAPVDPDGLDDSCPFDRRRNGYVLGEAAVSMVLEAAPQAIERGAPVRAILAGCGVTHEAFARGRFQPDGRGIEAAFREALRAAGREPSAVPWVLAGAHSAQAADLAEARAIRSVFGGGSAAPAVSAIKSMLGETEAASGSLGIAAAVLGMESGLLSPTVNCAEPDPECELDLVTAGRRMEVSSALVSAIWFGGGHAAVVVDRSVA
jgi:3-oxoacyl-(acyl-carrier-protein) synthase